MKVKLHLLSAPWSDPMRPSAQLGCLKAYVDQALGSRIQTRAYSGHFAIVRDLWGDRFQRSFQEHSAIGENFYLPLLIHRYEAKGLNRDARELTTMTAQINSERRLRPRLSAALLKKLETVTVRFLEREVLPELIQDGINVVGFPLNFHQLYASLYCEHFLREKARDKKLLFLYGGYGAGSEITAQMMKRFTSHGYRVFGEGEKKLETILKNLLEITNPENVSGALDIDGVLSPQDPAIGELKPESFFTSQVPRLQDLPVPDFDEYFHRISRAGEPMKTSVPIEGTRGCFARCDFCSYHSQWRGFRKLPADEVFKRVSHIVRAHLVKDLTFVDAVCDTWAERFAELVMENDLRVTMFMELRAHHPETFWTKLALAGLTEAQIGVESLSSSLLKKMGKGTYVFQNLSVQKYLAELGITSNSNIIIYHPKSTPDDVAETRRVLELTPHFPRFSLSPFLLYEDSPIFSSLTGDEHKAKIPRSVFQSKGPLKGAAYNLDYHLPERLRPDEGTTRAWEAFTNWYLGYHTKMSALGGSLRIRRLPRGRLVVEDTREENPIEYVLEGCAAAVYDRAHVAATPVALMRLGYTQGELDTVTESLLEKRLLIQSDGQFLSLALRPKQELIDRLPGIEAVHLSEASR